MDQWITDRLPTAADADSDGDVKVPDGIRSVPPHGFYQHHTLVVPGQPWWSEEAAGRVEVAAPAPAPTRKVVQIAASTGLDLFALCDDGTVWINDSKTTWAQLTAIPQEVA
jgi:hypothetical protein